MARIPALSTRFAQEWPHAATAVRFGRTSLVVLAGLDCSGDKATLRLLSRLLKEGADPNHPDQDGESLLFHLHDLRDWLPLLLDHGLDLQSPSGQALHGPLIARMIDHSHEDEQTIGEVVALMEAGLVPSLDTDWGMEAMEVLDFHHQEWADPIRDWLALDLLRKEAHDTRDNLDGVLPKTDPSHGSTPSPTSRHRL